MPFIPLEGAARPAPRPVPERGAPRLLAPAPRPAARVAQANPFDVVAIDELQRLVPTPDRRGLRAGADVARLLDRRTGPARATG